MSATADSSDGEQQAVAVGSKRLALKANRVASRQLQLGSHANRLGFALKRLAFKAKRLAELRIFDFGSQVASLVPELLPCASRRTTRSRAAIE
jgi:hypothetical protein